MEFKVTPHGQVRYRGTLQYYKLQSVTQLDTMVKSTKTETVPSWDRGGTAAAMARNEQTTKLIVISVEVDIWSPSENGAENYRKILFIKEHTRVGLLHTRKYSQS